MALIEMFSANYDFTLIDTPSLSVGAVLQFWVKWLMVFCWSGLG